MDERSNRLSWIDLEFSGLEPRENVILEAAAIVTDKDLNIVAKGPVIAIHANDTLLDGMDEWNTKTHNETGLVERCRQSSYTHELAEKVLLDFLKLHIDFNTAPLCGNSIHQDRRFLREYMPQLDEFHTYRIIDVTSFKEVANRWYPQIPEYDKKNTHKALDDIYESIEELKYYRMNIFK